MDPYKILEIDSSASDDEVKKAYRTLSKKYHPDANINNPNQAAYTEKFKQVQNAYKQIMDDRKRGFTGNYSNSYNSSYGSSQGYQSSNDTQIYNTVISYINMRQYQQAIQLLNSISDRRGQWYYLSAVAHGNLGDNITAFQHIQVALQYEPNNPEYMNLYRRFQGPQMFYQQASSQYGNPMASYVNCCYGLMLFNCLSSMCCGGSGMYGRGC